MTIGDVLEILKGLATCEIEHEVDPTLLRPSDVTLQIPDSSRFKAITGWKPEIPPEQTLSDLLDYQRERVLEQTRGPR